MRTSPSHCGRLGTPRPLQMLIGLATAPLAGSPATGSHRGGEWERRPDRAAARRKARGSGAHALGDLAGGQRRAPPSTCCTARQCGVREVGWAHRQVCAGGLVRESRAGWAAAAAPWRESGSDDSVVMMDVTPGPSGDVPGPRLRLSAPSAAGVRCAHAKRLDVPAVDDRSR